MNHYPLIGVSGSINKTEKELSIQMCYLNALAKAGAIPALLYPTLDDERLHDCLNGLDGVLLSGGVDVAPDRYGHDPINELGEVNPLRDDFEIRLVQAAAQMRMPVLGICRGIQSINVAMGGTLWQDIPTQYRTADGQKGMAHAQTRADFYTSHRVTIEEGTLLARVIGQREINVNSFHHQAVRDTAPCLKAVAHAADGIIEGIEHPDLPFFLGVQWHPERYFDRDATAMALFCAFAGAARNYQNQR